MSKNYLIIFLLTILLTTACNQNQQDFQEVQYEKLGNTSNPNTYFENMTNDTDQVPNTEPNTEKPNDTPIQNNPSQTDNNVTDNENIEQPNIDLGSPTQVAFPLYMTDFQQRWNAISDEQTGDLYIHHFQRLGDAGHFQASLKDKLNLKVQSQDNKQINKISIISTSKTKGEILQMLTSWWQVLLITNPQSEVHEIDTIFSEIGIGPNSNFEDLQTVNFSFGGLLYKVTPSQTDILFEAIYPNFSENQSLQRGT
jgi:hypothetical protein